MPEDAVKRSMNISIRKTQGYELVQADRILEAIKWFSDILTDAPDDAEIHLVLGDLYHQIKDDKLAILMYGQAKRLAPLLPGIDDRIARLGMPNYMSPANATAPLPDESEMVGGLLQQMAKRDFPISDEEIERAAELLKIILTSPQPAEVVAQHLDEIDSLLPALIELNIRQAHADNQHELAEGLEELLRNINLQVEHSVHSEHWTGSQAHPKHGNRPKILILNSDVQEFNHRLVLAAEALAGLGCEIWYSEEVSRKSSDLPDVVIVNNPHLSSHFMHRLAICAAANIPIICDIDQDFQEMPVSHPNYEKYGLSNLQNSRSYLASLMLAHRVTVPNSNLAGALSMARCPVHVVPDGWSQTNALWKKPVARRTSLNLGWVGLPGQVDDIAQVRRLVIRILREFPMTQLVIAGDPNVFQLFESLPEQRKLYLPAASAEESPYTYSQIDILCLPLRNIPFNRTVSDRNLMEAGVRRIPWLASPMPTFVEWAEGGLLAETNEKWYEELRKLVVNEDLRTTLGQQGYEKAKQREMQFVGAAWLNVVTDCLNGVPTMTSQAFMDE